MKLLLVLVLLVCRELIAEELRVILTQPMRQWRDSVLQFSQARQASSSTVLVLIAGIPAVILTVLLVVAKTATSGFWTHLLVLLVLIPVFIDRHLPSVLFSYRQQWLDAQVVDEPEVQLKQARLQMMTAYLQELFTPLCWFLLLGSWGIVVVSVYYSFRLCANQTLMMDVADRAKALMAVFDWLPSRLVVLSFALVGQFVETWRYWQANMSNYGVSAVEFVDAAAEQAEVIDHGQPLVSTLPMTLVKALAAYESLCYRSMLIWVVVLALHVML